MARLLILVIFLWATALRAEPVTVFAAASLKNALEEIAEGFEGEIRFSFAGSSVLARQVAAGAPADVYVSANVAWMDWLEGEDAIIDDSRRAVVGNMLVLIGSSPEPVALESFSGGPVAMALVNAVPAGIYGRQAFENLGLWDRVEVVQTDNVRAALALVAMGEVPYGVVYGSDALAEPRVNVVASFDPALHDPIVYPAAAVTKNGLAFLEHLAGETARSVFASQGFEVLR